MVVPWEGEREGWGRCRREFRIDHYTEWEWGEEKETVTECERREKEAHFVKSWRDIRINSLSSSVPSRLSFTQSGA